LNASSWPSGSKARNLDLQQLRRTVISFEALLSLIRIQDQKSVLRGALRCGKMFVDGFKKHGIPALEPHFISQRREVLDLIRVFQLGTRVLQVIYPNFCMKILFF
jgi:hypothetical protein